MTLQPGRNIRVASFFSGGGGLDLGFHKVGFEIAFATDVEPVFCSTLRNNIGKWFPSDLKIACQDIRDLDPSQLPKDINFVIGGPPCQSFSASGRRAGGAAGRLDSRGTLFQAYCRIIAALKPKGFLFENVRGILGTNKGEDWRQIVAAFEKLGYSVSFRILDACDYGIPQHRERLLLVGHTLGHDFQFPEPIYGADAKPPRPYISPAQAFNGIESTEDLHSLSLDNGKYAHLLPLVPPGGNYLFFTAKRGYPRPIFAYRSRFSDFLYKANPDYPVKTIIASPGKYTGPFHWENRCFSVAEYKRLQGFPDVYEFCGSRAEVIQQIGNSVSPKLAEHLALAIARQIFSRNADVDLMPADRKLSFDKRKGQTAQKTRERHVEVAKRQSNEHSRFRLSEYRERVEPCTLPAGVQNVRVSVVNKVVKIEVRGDSAERRFASMRLEIFDDTPDLFTLPGDINVTIEVDLYGKSPHSIQTMWNAIDSWVIRSSSFHSLYEIYGHFTEPHPVFAITRFKRFSRHPIVRFAAHAANFTNCSKYLPRTHLSRLFGKVFGTRTFAELVRILRSYRFDIRCYETNVAISPTKYMVAYPFTLPNRKQMNFSVKSRSQIRKSKHQETQGYAANVSD
jgi:DNA (cytosine-5)-methyltransferase 1